ncbi:MULTISPECIES: GNAT family N-acetyltransferase [unclassified Pantoea]|uniref:GNAT family N-acetyltransferase n=1 Tax=unclassified Pantoea TaxID=2630326 RepID=UPI0024773522|nr:MULTISPECIES: GNAT family N-acetyltransferase [unclassified Pantoea]GME41398.1 GNAT family N-acetyltransferase [Pantoea sp. QMID1]GME42792.1 GNAT family N-acetyltransferase [Pantoea sp. QMID3]GME56802.1 GNAT family N-acetyltransferase [Pantoea sp. QMID4]GME59038.1 GNAT family N-acetyltransferase [Pantoea sp. QMID2]
MINMEVGNPIHYPELLKVWESSVRATHDFLQEQDIQALRPLILHTYLPDLTITFAQLSCNNSIVGFTGVSKNRIEMLFVDANQRGKGIGKLLLLKATNEQGADELDVNEQNPQAITFYKKHGFETVGRSDVDGRGKPYPLLHMKLRRT